MLSIINFNFHPTPPPPNEQDKSISVSAGTVPIFIIFYYKIYLNILALFINNF